MHMIDEATALIYTMVIVSAADREMSDRELHVIGETVAFLPVFDGVDRDRLPAVTAACADLLQREQGLAELLAAIDAALPDPLKETAYALACDIAAADGVAGAEELRVLELIQAALTLDPLIAAAIERAAQARFARP